MKKTMINFASLLALLFVLVSFPNPNILATESLTPSTAESVESQTTSYPSKIYVERTVRHFSTWDYTIPPASFFETRSIGGKRYSGTLTRYSYANAGEYWIVIYTGYLHIN